MNEPETYFYHSFPRRSREEPSELATGLDILSSIAASGFLLTPEITEWREPRSDGLLGESWQLIQKSCSFTELLVAELAEHSQQFGRFSIEFDPQTLRYLGGIPVHYLPRGKAGDVGLEYLAASLMVRTGEIQFLLDRLAEIEELAATTDDKSQLLVVPLNGQRSLTRCSIGGAEDILRHIKIKLGGVSVRIQRNALRALSAFFYPAEDFESTGPLHYYRQREWRLIANMAKDGRSLDRDLSDAEKARLMAIDGDFFGKTMKFHTGSFARVDECRIFEELYDKPLLQHASRIIAPRDAIGKAEERLGEFNQIPVVALEDLTTTKTCE